MAMNDEETVALTAGGHTVGKCHGNGSAASRARHRKAPICRNKGWAGTTIPPAALAVIRSAAGSKGHGPASRPSGITATLTCCWAMSGP
ncbi:hypothetical protein O0544_01765 [Edwardsiella anguillarum]|nr:hypothetical protein [Edwardsiella anguillarum]